jgi:hypothetical protein
MKTRKIIPTYAVLSLGQIRQIAKFAEASALDMYGYPESKHCIILNGLSVKVEGKLQFSAEKIRGGGREVGFTWE